MCVISIINNKNEFPTKDTMELMYKSNSHYSSICFFDEVKKQLYVKRGIELKEIIKISNKAKKQGNYKQIQHYRIASSGSHDNKSLNHGFEIKKNSKNLNSLEFYSSHDQFFHNGTIDLNILNDLALKIMVNNPDAVYPSGEISDSKLLAFILAYTDYSILNMFTDSNKFCIISGKNGSIKRYGKWDILKDDNRKMTVSNDYFKHDYLKSSYSFDEEPSMLEYLTKDEKKEFNRLSKKYDWYFEDCNDILDDYLAYGISIFDIESQIDNEIEYNQGYDKHE